MTRSRDASTTAPTGSAPARPIISSVRSPLESTALARRTCTNSIDPAPPARSRRRGAGQAHPLHASRSQGCRPQAFEARHPRRRADASLLPSPPSPPPRRPTFIPSPPPLYPRPPPPHLARLPASTLAPSPSWHAPRSSVAAALSRRRASVGRSLSRLVRGGRAQAASAERRREHAAPPHGCAHQCGEAEEEARSEPHRGGDVARPGSHRGERRLGRYRVVPLLGRQNVTRKRSSLMKALIKPYGFAACREISTRCLQQQRQQQRSMSGLSTAQSFPDFHMEVL